MSEPVQTISSHYQRQATPEVWSEVDALRAHNEAMERALVRALTDVGCLQEGRCPHWVEWHNVARDAVGSEAVAMARDSAETA